MVTSKNATWMLFLHRYILKVPSTLSLVLQENEVDIIQGIKSFLKAASSLNALSSKSPEEWSTVKLVVSRISEDASESTYQGSKLTGYCQSTLSECAIRAKADLEKLQSNIKDRIAWSDTHLLRSIVIFLDTCSWSTRVGAGDEDNDDKSHIKEDIISVFREPLESEGAELFSLQDELEEVVDFFRRYLNTGEEYKKVWYKLFTAPDARKWPNVLLLCKLLFSLPFTNSKVERAFSIMKIIKTDRRNSLNTSTLDDLMKINVEGPTPENFHAERAVSLHVVGRLHKEAKSAT